MIRMCWPLAVAQPLCGIKPEQTGGGDYGFRAAALSRDAATNRSGNTTSPAGSSHSGSTKVEDRSSFHSLSVCQIKEPLRFSQSLRDIGSKTVGTRQSNEIFRFLDNVAANDDVNRRVDDSNARNESD